LAAAKARLVLSTPATPSPDALAPLPPDMITALANSPLVSGDVTSICTETPPADSPTMVTLAGSPPNAAIFRFTHFSAAI